MKRSMINNEISQALKIFKDLKIYLPSFAIWPPKKWEEDNSDFYRIRLNGLGWDITDFGSQEFNRIGAVILTLRNGNCYNVDEGTPYAEKLIILKPGQEIPLHFHWKKTEDIINRGGGIFMIQLYQSDINNHVDFSKNSIVYCDGIKRVIPAGGILELLPGDSITLTPNLFHRFWAKEEDDILVLGEVSSVNDDKTDNYFNDPAQRYSTIEEDEPSKYLLCNEYMI